VNSARLIYRPEYQTYDFGPQHPLRPERLRTSFDLLSALDIEASPDEVLSPASATINELMLVHDRAYVDAVQHFSHGPSGGREAGRWGMGPGDSPAFSGMHEASAAIAGGTLHGLRGILRGEFEHAFNPAGGLHHAMRARASGFCVYNDPAIAIAAAVQEHDVRVLYLDFDAHHGDGVQAAFYNDPRVLTFSIHETGRHLFPGTGFVDELGEGDGRGYSLNVPVEPFTEDASWLECINMLVPRVAESFAPDVIVSQHGCDSHAWDPITHLRISTRAFAAQARLVHELAHRVCKGRWIATGGGGYDWVRVVPRSWSLVWAEMTERSIEGDLPRAWRARWEAVGEEHGFWPIPTSVLDDSNAWPAPPRRDEIARANRAQSEALSARLTWLNR
jgi:acetoin utilization protein AcuC